MLKILFLRFHESTPSYNYKLQWFIRVRDLLIDLRLNIKIKLTADKVFKLTH